VRLADLTLVSPRSEPAAAPPPPAAPQTPATPARSVDPAPAPVSSGGAAGPAAGPAQSMEDIVKTIERLADLRQKNILTEDEFLAKKAELLGRL